MIIAALFVGVLTAYWFGLRAGAYAATATFVLCAAALFLPKYALPIYLVIAAGVVAVCVIGPRRKRPPDAVLATRWVRRTIGQVVTLARGASLFAKRTTKADADKRDDRDDDRRRP
jgi:hypothetical protein